jgi:hypothetical protein
LPIVYQVRYTTALWKPTDGGGEAPVAYGPDEAAEVPGGAVYNLKCSGPIASNRLVSTLDPMRRKTGPRK